ncbi:MAG: hypothetical protein ACHQJ5_05905 [Vicinamibacteria bacterium]
MPLAALRPGSRARSGLIGALLAGVSLACAAGASASFETGLAGAEYESTSSTVRGQALDASVDAGARVVRLTAAWSSIAAQPPADPRDPADSAYRFEVLDAAVTDVLDRGLKPILTIVGAPRFAEGPHRPASAPAGSWKPDPGDLGAFAHAITSRYSGSFQGLGRVRYYQVWNEPNLGQYLSPQYRGRRAVGAEIYRKLLNSFYAEAHAVHPDNVVITGGTAPYGDPPGGTRTRPLAFLRDLLCLRGRKDLRAVKCRSKADFDVLAHHPINTSGGPTRSAIDPDDASTPDFANVGRVLRAAERRRTTGTRGRHQLWATELWWESDPPDARRGVPLARQARYIEQALYLLWKQGARVVINLQLADPAPAPHNPGSVDAGLLFHDRARKPAFQAFRFPFVTDRAGGRSLRAWGKAPVGGRLAIQLQRGSGWRTVKTLRVRGGKVFTANLRARGKGRFRASVAAERSLVWRQR